MKADKNTIIGMIIIGILFFGYFWYTNKTQQATLRLEQIQKQHVVDSLALLEPITPAVEKQYPIHTKKASTATRNQPIADTENITTLENAVVKIVFSNKGGCVKFVELKKYTSSHDNKLVTLCNNDVDKMNYPLQQNNTTVASTNLFFTVQPIVTNADGSQTLRYKFENKDSQTVVHEFIVHPDSYLIDWNIQLTDAQKLLPQGTFNFSWQNQVTQQQKEIQYERDQTEFVFSEDNSFDYMSRNKDKQFEQPVQWVGVAQRFFNVTVIAKNNFDGGKIALHRTTEDTASVLATTLTQLHAKINGTTATVPLQLFYGPNDYTILKKLHNNMDEIVNLGRGMYAFVRPINRFILMPVFYFFAGFITNFGWVIALLTLFIRLATSPLTYSSYVSGAKMKLLRPELDELKKKHAGNQQAFAVDQMKLMKEAGASPLSGCIPALLQIPIFFALYSFFNSNIALRGQAFLWATDLSSYDIIVMLPFSIPLGFGNHISLFNILAVLTSFAISLYNIGNTPTQDNPAMKYMPYIFPFMMLFFFNRLPSALTWYYTVSNTITLILQFIIQNYIIDHEKIMAKMQEARKNPKRKAKSKWQERLEQMQEAQKKMQEMKAKTTKK